MIPEKVGIANVGPRRHRRTNCPTCCFEVLALPRQRDVGRDALV